MLVAAICAAAGTLVLAGSALAAPDRTFTLTTDAPTATWNGKLGTGTEGLSGVNALPKCGTPVIHDCDYTLIHVTEPGVINVATASDGTQTQDVALNVYDSDATGAQSDLEGHSDGSGVSADEATSVENDAPSGTDVYYLVEIDYLLVFGGQPKGTATLAPLS
jgi:hypothetical protein